jgi:hypothetical protein
MLLELRKNVDLRCSNLDTVQKNQRMKEAFSPEVKQLKSAGNLDSSLLCNGFLRNRFNYCSSEQTNLIGLLELNAVEYH